MGERVDQLFGDAVAQVILIAPGTHVSERQNGDRGQSRGGSIEGGRGRSSTDLTENELERRSQIAGALESICGILFETPSQDLVDRGHQRHGSTAGPRRLAEDGRKGLD